MIIKNANPKVTEYIENSEDFAKPILTHLREQIHKNCPDVIESIKWGAPHFDYKKDFMCVVASAKNHCSLTFIKSEFMTDLRFAGGKKVKPGQRFMSRITSISDLPSDAELASFIKEAMDLNDRGIKLDKTAKAAPGASQSKLRIISWKHYQTTLPLNKFSKTNHHHSVETILYG